MRDGTCVVVDGGLGDDIAGVTRALSGGVDAIAGRPSRYDGDNPYAFAADEGDIEFEFPSEESMNRDVRGCSCESGRECAGVTYAPFCCAVVRRILVDTVGWVAACTDSTLTLGGAAPLDFVCASRCDGT